jgi:Glycosyltransferase
LEGSYEVVYHDWREHGVIKPTRGDVLLGHPHPAQGTIFRRSAREPGWARVLMMSPYAHGSLRHVAFADPIIRDCDLFLAITGPYWFDSVAASPCSHWLPKMVHLDLAVDLSEFPALTRVFSPTGTRTFVYIGSTAPPKNTSYLTNIARRIPSVPIAWIGAGSREIPGLERLGPADFATPEGRAMVARFDFLVTVGKSDANPTTILEAMAWGILPVCTPQSGYSGIPSIINVPVENADEAAAVLAGLNDLPDERLREMQAANWRLLDEHYNWARFTDQIVSAIESSASPPLGYESRIRRILLVCHAQFSPFGPLSLGLHNVDRKVKHLTRTLARTAHGSSPR